MKKMTLSDVQPIAEYELTRDSYRREIMDHKRHRRVNLGPDIGITFEDRRTMLFQVQEMMRAEKMVEPATIQEELDIYNSLIPEPGELSATLFIEITQADEIKPQLERFIGLTEGDRLWLEAGAERSYARFEEGRSTEDQISAVHYIRFDVSPQLQQALADASRPARLGIDHRDYRHLIDLSAETRQALLADLTAA